MASNKQTGIDVSIIIPVYNVEEYLDECVQSAMAQSHRNIEIVLVDDGSSDSSGIMCDAYAEKDSRITVVHKPNGGLGSARNVGIDTALGEYILFLDSDDYLDLNAAEVLYQRAAENNLDMLLFTAESFVDGIIPEDLGIGDYRTYKTRLDEVMEGEECLAYLLQTKEYIVSNCMRMYRRTIMRFRYSEDIIHEDEDIGIYTFLLSKRVMMMDAPFYKRRYRAGSIMTSANQAAEAAGYMHAAMKMLEYHDMVTSENTKNVLLGLFERNINTVCEKYLSATPAEMKQIGKLVKKNAGRVISGKWPVSKKTLLKMFFPWLIETADLKKRYPEIEGYAKLDANLKTNIARMIFGKGKKIYLIGTPTHGNYGDHLIAMSENAFFKKYFHSWKELEITMTFAVKNLRILRRHIMPHDIICISGGGWLGTKWRRNEDFVRRIIVSFPDNPIVILPQTAYYEEDEAYVREGARIYSSHKKLLVCLREQESYRFMIKNGFVEKEKALLMPDFGLLYHGDVEKPSAKRDVIKVCLRQDIEKAMSDNYERALRENAGGLTETEDYETNITPLEIGTKQREQAVKDKIREISEGRLLITDRLHGMIFAAIAGTPCLAYDNGTHKVSGVYNWIRELDYIRLSDGSSDDTELMETLYECNTTTLFGNLDFSKYERKLRDRILMLSR